MQTRDVFRSNKLTVLIMLVEIKNAHKESFRLLGGKGFQLGKLASLNLNVPKGFVVSTEYFEKDLDDISEEIFNMYKKLHLHKVAVRSSGNLEDSRNLSFAGLLKTYLNVEKEDLLLSIQKIWHQKNSENVKMYLHKYGISSDDLKIAIIVQEMVEPEYAGVGFSVNPITLNNDEIIIEIVRGIGGKLVSGTVTPNTYFVNKKDSKISNSNIVDVDLDNQLNQTVLEEISRTINLLESTNGTPVDVEFAVNRDSVFYLQYRPITTL